MQNTILEPFYIHVSTPCSYLTISLAFAMVHLCPLLPFRKEEGSSMQPVASSTAVPEIERCWW